jgi:hypothetical protein
MENDHLEHGPFSMASWCHIYTICGIDPLGVHSPLWIPLVGNQQTIEGARF